MRTNHFLEEQKTLCEHKYATSLPIKCSCFSTKETIDFLTITLICVPNCRQTRRSRKKVLPGWINFTLTPVESQWVWKPKSGLLLGLRVRLTLMSLWSTWKAPTHTHTHTHTQTHTSVKVTPIDPMSCASWWKLETSEACYRSIVGGYTEWWVYYAHCHAIITMTLQQIWFLWTEFIIFK